MKKTILTTVFCLFAALISFNNVDAQTVMGWDGHGVGFIVPDGFYVEVNNNEEFSFTNGDVSISLMPWQDVTIEEEDLARTVLEATDEMNYNVASELEYFEHDNFIGYSVAGVKDGVAAMISLVLDTQSSTNLMVIAIANPGYEDLANRICETIYTYN